MFRSYIWVFIGKLLFCGLFSYILLTIFRFLFSFYDKIIPNFPHPTPILSIFIMGLAFFVGLFLVHWLPSKLKRYLSKKFELPWITAIVIGTSLPLIVGVILDEEDLALAVSAIINFLGFFYPNILGI